MPEIHMLIRMKRGSEMKIVMIHPHDIFSHKEPWTIRIKALAKEFMQLGYNVVLITFTLDGFEEREFEHEGIKIISLQRKTSIRYLFYKMKYFQELFKDADLIYFQKCFHYVSVPVLYAAKKTDKWIHYDWDDCETAIFYSGKQVPSRVIGWGLSLIERLLPQMVNSISVSSENLYQLALKRKGDPEFLIKVHVGSDFDRVINPDDVKNLKMHYGLNSLTQIYIGQLQGGQYVDILLKTTLELKNNSIKTKTLIVGDGYDRKRLENLVSEMGLEKECIFTGACDHKCIPVYLAACDIAIACFEKNEVTKSKSPLKIAEYLNAGKAIIAHDVGEVSEMLGGAGILIDTDDNNGLRDAIILLHKNPQLIKQLEEKSRNRAGELTWKLSALKLHKLFQKINPDNAFDFKYKA